MCCVRVTVCHLLIFLQISFFPIIHLRYAMPSLFLLKYPSCLSRSCVILLQLPILLCRSSPFHLSLQPICSETQSWDSLPRPCHPSWSTTGPRQLCLNTWERTSPGKHGCCGTMLPSCLQTPLHLPSMWCLLSRRQDLCLQLTRKSMGWIMCTRRVATLKWVNTQWLSSSWTLTKESLPGHRLAWSLCPSTRCGPYSPVLEEARLPTFS